MLRDLVKNKEKLMFRASSARGTSVLQKLNSVDSDVSDGSTLVRPRHKNRKTLSTSDVTTVRCLLLLQLSARHCVRARSPSSSVLSTKSRLSAGFRFREGELINLQPSPEPNRVYLFEHLIGIHYSLTSLCFS